MQAWLNYWLPIPFNWPSSLEQFAGFSTEVYLKGWSLTKFVSLLLLWHLSYFWKYFHHLNPVCFCVSRSSFIFLIKSPCDCSTFPCDWGWYGLFFVISIFLFFTKLFDFTVKLFSSITLKCPTVSVLIKNFLEFRFYSKHEHFHTIPWNLYSNTKKYIIKSQNGGKQGKYMLNACYKLLRNNAKSYTKYTRQTHPTHNSIEN